MQSPKYMPHNCLLLALFTQLVPSLKKAKLLALTLLDSLTLLFLYSPLCENKTGQPFM